MSLEVYEREDAIKTYIKTAQSCYVGIYRHLINDKIEEMEVYELPLRLLRFNNNNGRIFSERIALERKLGFKLDSSNEAHKKHFIDMLLPNEEDTLKLVDAMQKTGQAVPGLITTDGVLLNANRRFAVKCKLNHDTIFVSILPPTIDEKTKYAIEFGLQVKDDLKKEYTGINRLFMIRRGIDAGYNEEFMKQKFGVNPSEIKEALEVLRLIDLFLEENERDEDYDAVGDMLEHFKDFYKELCKMVKEGIDKYEMTEVFFKLMSLNLDHKNVIPHRDIRDTMYISAKDEKIKEILTRNLSKKELNADEIKTDVGIAKGLAKARKDNESVLKTIRKLIDQIEGVNIADANYDTSNFPVDIANELNKLMATTQKFVEEVNNELPKHFESI